MAAMLPTVIVITAMIPKASVQSRLSATAPITITLKAAAKPAFLVPAASRAAIVGGAPSYASGSHIWNGTKPILKPNPAINIPTAKSPIGIKFASRTIKP